MENSELIEQITKIIYKDGFACRGNQYGGFHLKKENLIIALNHYLKTGKNVLPEYDCIHYVAWLLTGDYHSDKTLSLNLVLNYKSFLRKVQKNTTFWKLDNCFPPAQVNYLKSINIKETCKIIKKLEEKGTIKNEYK